METNQGATKTMAHKMSYIPNNILQLYGTNVPKLHYTKITQMFYEFV